VADSGDSRRMFGESRSGIAPSSPPLAGRMHAARTGPAADAPRSDFHGAYSTLKQPYHLPMVCRELSMSDFTFAVPVFEYRN
jgi:hypothetical protein